MCPLLNIFQNTFGITIFIIIIMMCMFPIDNAVKVENIRPTMISPDIHVKLAELQVEKLRLELELSKIKKSRRNKLKKIKKTDSVSPPSSPRSDMDDQIELIKTDEKD